MRLGWYSNAPWCSTGYGVQTSLHTRFLQSQGHDLAIFANWGLEGAALDWGGIQVYPKGVDAESLTIIASHAEAHNADAVVTLYDAWSFKDVEFGVPWVAYFPVDQEPLNAKTAKPLSEAAVRIAMSRFGQRMTRDTNQTCEYLPHGYSAADYHPDLEAGAESVEHLGVEDRFVVGVVAANKGLAGAPHRKSFVQIIEAFKEFHKSHSDAFLYLHSFAHSNFGGLDLQGVCDWFELEEGSYGIPPTYGMWMGLSTDKMRGLYNAMDVLLSPSMGEGFGVPIMEAQACGTPVITGDWTAMPEITKTGVCIPKEDATRYYWPEYSYQWMPDPGAIVNTLEAAYDVGKVDAEARVAISQEIQEYEIHHVCKTYWPPILDRILEAVDAAKLPQLNRAQRRAKQPA